MAEEENKTINTTTTTTKKRATTTAKTYSKEDLDKAVAEASKKAAEEAVAAYAASLQKQTEAQSTGEGYVTLMYVGLCAEGTSVVMPNWGTINYSGGMLSVTKRDFMQGYGIPVNNALLRKRRVVVTSGLTDEERSRFGLTYGSDDILSRTQFADLLKYPSDKVIEIFTALCVEHKRIVADMYKRAYFETHEISVNPNLVKRLNEISKADDKDGMFTIILEDMGKKFAQ